jgi:hypothetical protein
MRITSLFALALLLRATSSHAEPEPEPGDRSPPAPAPAKSRVLPTAAAVIPGVIVHGAGHFAADDASTAKNLLLMEGLGLGLFVSGGATIVLTGASRYFVGPAATATMLGFGLFSGSFLADIYGNVSRDGGAAQARLRGPATWETEVGYRRIQDDEFAYRDFVVEKLSRRIGRVRLSPSGWFSLKGDSARYRAEGQYRLLGDVDEPQPHDLSYLDVTLAFTHQRHSPEHFSKSSAELSLDARYDLGRLGPTLRGAFLELGTGYALGRIDYNLTGVTVPHDIEHLLLGRVGFGVTLRGQSAPGSEALVYYDHRHDDYVAGLKLSGIGSGVLGHFGLAARWFFSSRVGVALDAQAGSAYLAGASLLLREGQP